MTEPTYGSPPGGQIANRPNSAAIVAVVTGIVALLLSWIPAVNLIAFLLAAVAVVTGAVGVRNAGRPGVDGRGKAVTGIVTGILALVLGVLVYVGLVAVLNENPELQQNLQQIEQQIEQQP